MKIHYLSIVKRNIALESLIENLIRLMSTRGQQEGQQGRSRPTAKATNCVKIKLGLFRLVTRLIFVERRKVNMTNSSMRNEHVWPRAIRHTSIFDTRLKSNDWTFSLISIDCIKEKEREKRGDSIVLEATLRFMHQLSECRQERRRRKIEVDAVDIEISLISTIVHRLLTFTQRKQDNCST